MTESQEPRGFAADVAAVFVRDGDEEWEEVVRSDLTLLGAAETVRQFEQAEAILQGLLRSAEAIGVCLYLAIGEASFLAREARERAEGYVRPAKGGE